MDLINIMNYAQEIHNEINILFVVVNKEDAQDEKWKQDTLMKSDDFRRMMDRISDVEKCLAKISELKAVYNRMDAYSSYKEKYKSTRESSGGYENSAYKTSLEMTTSGLKH